MQRRLGRKDETLSTTDGVQLGQQCGHSFVEVRARAAERRHSPCQPRNVPCAQRAHEESEQLERKRGKRDTVPSRHPSVVLVRRLPGAATKAKTWVPTQRAEILD